MRAFTSRGDEIRELSSDQSIRQVVVDEGVMTADEANVLFDLGRLARGDEGAS